MTSMMDVGTISILLVLGIIALIIGILGGWTKKKEVPKEKEAPPESVGEPVAPTETLPKEEPIPSPAGEEVSIETLGEGWEGSDRPLEELGGIGKAYGGRLRSAGIVNVGDLLRAGARRGDRIELAKKIELPESRLHLWVKRAALYMVVRGIREYSTLLEEAGINTLPELSQRSPETLYNELKELGSGKGMEKLPSLEDVKGWIERAKESSRIIEY
jgi:predicted flap endonuclease-1-like 5' DNA nuclease